MVIFLASLALVSGLMVVRAKNPVHSVLFSIPVFRDTSGLLLLLGLDFSAMISPVVHIGAIAASFLFVVMIPRQWVWKGAKVVLKEMIVSFFLLWISPVLWDWGLTWVAPLVVLFEEWLDLVLSSMEGFPLPSTTSSPAPSISSRGVSWIDEYFGPEVSSSAPDDQGPRQQEAVVQPTAPDDQGPRQQEEVVQPTAPDDQGPRQQEEVVQPTRQASPSSSTGVGPTLEELRSRLYSFLSSFSKIKPRSSFIISTEEELGIADASPEKLAKIAQMIGRLTDGPNRPNSGQNAKALLTMEVEEWSKANEGGAV